MPNQCLEFMVARSTSLAQLFTIHGSLIAPQISFRRGLDQLAQYFRTIVNTDIAAIEQKAKITNILEPRTIPSPLAEEQTLASLQPGHERIHGEIVPFSSSCSSISEAHSLKL